MSKEVYDYEQVNLHTHFYMCGHAIGEAQEYVDQAVKEGLKVIGFSDHCPLPDYSYSGSRMDYARLGQYVEYVNKEKERTDIKVYLGAECDFRPDLAPFYRSLGFDYLTCSVHYANSHYYISHYPNSRRMLFEYTDNYTKALESGIFLFGNHPDLFALFYLNWDDEAKACAKQIIQAAQAYDVSLEINAYGLRKDMIQTPAGMRHSYPIRPFWELASLLGGVKTIVNSDAHRPQDVCACVDVGYRMAEELGLKTPDLIVEGSKLSLE